jgi:ABC-type spermidine/putrescine transport system permease subunit I
MAGGGGMRLGRGAGLLLAAVLLVFLGLYVLPLATLVRESFKVYRSGRIGGLAGTFTLDNYAELLSPAYATYFLDTFRIGFVATVLGLVLSYPIAHFVARGRGPLRTFWIALLVSMLFVGTLVRAYSLALTFGPVGILLPVARFLGVSPNSLAITELVVIAGLLHYVVPLMALTLVGTIHNVNPALEQVAQSLGAPRWKAFFTITVLLSGRGILSAFLLGYALTISSFVIPLVLGKGVVLFATNLVFNRFSEMANFPGGAAIAVVMLALSFLIIYGIVRVVGRRLEPV